VTYSSSLKPFNNSFSGQVSSIHAQVVSQSAMRKTQNLKMAEFIVGSRKILFEKFLKDATKELNKEKQEMIEQWMEDNNLEYIPGRKPLVREKGTDPITPPDKPEWL